MGGARHSLRPAGSVFGDEGKQGEQEQEKATEEIHEKERARSFKAREENILVVDETPVKGKTKGHRQTQLVPRKEETEGDQGNEQGHVGNGDRKLHLLYVFHGGQVASERPGSALSRGRCKAHARSMALLLLTHVTLGGSHSSTHLFA